MMKVSSSDDENKACIFPNSDVRIRKFRIPQIKVTAKVYCKMSSLNLENMPEPLAIKYLINADIEAIRGNKLFSRYPCHNQASCSKAY